MEKIFAVPSEVFLAHAHGKVALHDPITVRLPRPRPIIRGEDHGRLVTLAPCRRVATTVGRVFFDDVLPQGMAFYDVAMTAAVLKRVVADCHALLGRRATVELLDRLKSLGFHHATRSGLSFSVADLHAPVCKEEVLRRTQRLVDAVKERYRNGDVSAAERDALVVELWLKARDRIGREVMAGLERDHHQGRPHLNPIYLMAASGARGSAEQLRQLAGMRGLIAKPSGEVIQTPVKSSFREGLSVLEYFSSTHGARKGLADTALKTSVSGYLTRKLADVAQNVVVTLHDCGTSQGIDKEAEYVRGRVSCATIAAADGSVIVRGNEVITPEAARRLEEQGVGTVRVRSPLTCEAPRGVCRQCYGVDLSTGELVEEGMAVGIIAAQSIGEPGTQLTMRNFHIGGVHSSQDITLGLPRVIELFEARRPGKNAPPAAVLAEVAGRVRRGQVQGKKGPVPVVAVKPRGGAEVEHLVAPEADILVATGDEVELGQPLTAGRPLPRDVLRLCGVEAARAYLLREVRAVYREQGVPIDDKHFEVVIARMLAKVKVRSAGDTDLLPGAVVDRAVLRQANDRLARCRRVTKPGNSRYRPGQLVNREELAGVRRQLKAAGKQPPVASRPRPATAVAILQGISRAAVESESFLSAASFQETTQVLADAALAGKVDTLAGLKENVLVGRLIPAGTGFRRQLSVVSCRLSVVSQPLTNDN
jgi:DNA-directed RNA polymerase subunit beta'